MYSHAHAGLLEGWWLASVLVLSTPWYNRGDGVTRDAGSHMCHAPWSENLRGASGWERCQSIASPEARAGEEMIWYTFREGRCTVPYEDGRAAGGHSQVRGNMGEAVVIVGSGRARRCGAVVEAVCLAAVIGCVSGWRKAARHPPAVGWPRRATHGTSQSSIRYACLLNTSFTGGGEGWPGQEGEESLMCDVRCNRQSWRVGGPGVLLLNADDRCCCPFPRPARWRMRTPKRTAQR